METRPFRLAYVPRPPTGFVLAAVELMPFSVASFDATQQQLFIAALALLAGVDASAVEIVSVQQTEKIDLRRAPPRAGAPPAARRAVFDDRIDVRFKARSSALPSPPSPLPPLRTAASAPLCAQVYSNASGELVDIEGRLTDSLAREGALTAQLVELGLYGAPGPRPPPPLSSPRPPRAPLVPPSAARDAQRRARSRDGARTDGARAPRRHLDADDPRARGVQRGGRARVPRRAPKSCGVDRGRRRGRSPPLVLSGHAASLTPY